MRNKDKMAEIASEPHRISVVSSLLRSAEISLGKYSRGV